MRLMRRRFLVVAAVTLVRGAAVAVLVVRQLIFGGPPSIHRSAGQGSPAACASGASTPGGRAFAISAQRSSASYTAHFQAAGQPLPGTVTGVTGDVKGNLVITSDADPVVQSLMLTVDLRTLDSGSSQRDDHVRNDTFEVSKYPLATFVARDVQILTGRYTEGQVVSFKLPGELTLHGVTRPATFDVQGKLVGDTLTGSGTTVIHIADYHMQQPQITSVVTVTIQKDIGLRIDFVAQSTNCPAQPTRPA